MVSCTLAVGLLIAMLFTMISPEKVSLMHDYEALLSSAQRTKYHALRKERLQIYLTGFALGILLAILVVYGLRRQSVFTNVCLTGAIVFVVAYFYYVFTPKSDYMILHLDEKEDRVAWLRIYRHMTLMYHLGFVVGVLAVMLFCYAWMKK
jgi:heme/copper-type cytochrome/quinol oxidase subunit 4